MSEQQKLTRRGELSSVIHKAIKHDFGRGVVVVKVVRSGDSCQRIRCHVLGGPKNGLVEGDFLRRYIVFVTSFNREVVSFGGLQGESHDVVSEAVHNGAPGLRGVQNEKNPAYFLVSNQIPGGRKPETVLFIKPGTKGSSTPSR
jgi:hypothetical protein